MSLQFQGASQQYKFYRDGLDSGAWEEQEHGMRWQLQQPGVRQWWRAWSGRFPQEFGDVIERLIREGEAAV